jgi:hypothetical protein
MRVLETQWWRLGLPDEWNAEQDDESILITDRDEVGTIEISHLIAEPGEAQPSIEELAKLNAEHDNLEWSSCCCGDFDGVETVYLEDGAAIRELWLRAQSLTLFVTYVCDEENRGLDDAIVDEILDGLELVVESLNE